MGVKDELKLNVGQSWEPSFNLVGKVEGLLLYFADLGRVRWKFDEEYYTQFLQDQKHQEFMKLLQGSKTVTEYETELTDLANFLP